MNVALEIEENIVLVQSLTKPFFCSDVTFTKVEICIHEVSHFIKLICTVVKQISDRLSIAFDVLICVQWVAHSYHMKA